MRKILVALGALHLLALVSYFTIPFSHETGRSLFEELYDVDFLIFPAILVVTWALISVLVLLRYRSIGHPGSAGALRFLSIAICIVLAAFAAGISGMVPPAMKLFASFGADLPAPTLLLMAGHEASWLLPALGVVLAGVIVAAGARRERAARIAFDGQIGLLVLANASLVGGLGALFLPQYKMCGDIRHATGFTRLHAAAALGREESARRHLAGGVPVNAVDESGSTPLYYAAAAGNVPIAKTLLDKGALATPVTNARSTPLHAAAIRGHAELAGLLLARGADVNAEDARGHTPLDWAEDAKQGAVARLLIERGGLRSTDESRRLRTERPRSVQARAESAGECGV